MNTIPAADSMAVVSPILLPSRSEVAVSIRRWRRAHTQLDAHLAQGVEPVKALRHLGLSAWKAGVTDYAVHVLKAAAALAPGDASIWADLAGVYQACGEPEEARACILLSLEHDDREPRRWLFLAGLFRDTQEDVNAEKAFLKALALDPLLHDAWVGLGILYFQQRRLPQAVEALRLAIRHGSRTIAVHACLGEALYLQGDIAGAADAYAAQVKLGPNEPKITQKFAFIRFLQALIAGPLDEALIVYRALAGIRAEETDVLFRDAFHVLSGYGYTEAAIRCGRARLAETPDDPIQRYLLAALEGAPVERAPRDYLVRYFDQFAKNFDQKLVDVLDYRIPEKLHGLLTGIGRPFAVCLDAGCGTGLVGALLRKPGRTLTGVDISARMLEKAAERGVYTQLIEADIGDFLAHATEVYDLVVAADVFIYTGDLTALIAAVTERLARNGIFAFSIETTDAADYTLLASGRFAHRRAFVEALLSESFEIVNAVQTQIRLDAMRPVAGMLFVARKRR